MVGGTSPGGTGIPHTPNVREKGAYMYYFAYGHFGQNNGCTFSVVSFLSALELISRLIFTFLK